MTKISTRQDQTRTAAARELTLQRKASRRVKYAQTTTTLDAILADGALRSGVTL